MTQKHISHPEGLPACRAGHSARHIHDERRASAGGGHFIECKCMATTRHAELALALAEWRRINRPARSVRKAKLDLPDNVLQLPLLVAPREVRRVGG